jgi:hypothetical protein
MCGARADCCLVKALPSGGMVKNHEFDKVSLSIVMPLQFVVCSTTLPIEKKMFTKCFFDVNFSRQHCCCNFHNLSFALPFLWRLYLASFSCWCSPWARTHFAKNEHSLNKLLMLKSIISAKLRWNYGKFLCLPCDDKSDVFIHSSSASAIQYSFRYSMSSCNANSFLFCTFHGVFLWFPSFAKSFFVFVANEEI